MGQRLCVCLVPCLVHAEFNLLCSTTVSQLKTYYLPAYASMRYTLNRLFLVFFLHNEEYIIIVFSAFRLLLV